MPLFDSHAHMSIPEILPQIDSILERAKEADVSKILNICIDPNSLKAGLEIEKKYPEVRNAAATTPHDVEKEGEEFFPIFESAAKSKQIVAVGETGLDYYYKELDPKVQKRFLIKYLHLAAESDLPVIFHCREAFQDLFEIADQEYPKNKPAVLHCFTGTIEDAENVLARGWHLSISGIVTFKKSELLRSVAKMVPLNQLLIETDTPYLAPQSKRGKQNEPSFLIETAQCIAKERGISIDEVTFSTFENAKKLFKM